MNFEVAELLSEFDCCSNQISMISETWIPKPIQESVKFCSLLNTCETILSSKIVSWVLEWHNTFDDDDYLPRIADKNLWKLYSFNVIRIDFGVDVQIECKNNVRFSSQLCHRLSLGIGFLSHSFSLAVPINALINLDESSMKTWIQWIRIMVTFIDLVISWCWLDVGLQIAE